MQFDRNLSEHCGQARQSLDDPVEAASTVASKVQLAAPLSRNSRAIRHLSRAGDRHEYRESCGGTDQSDTL